MAGPSLAIFGAYFPSWMLCLLIGIIATLVIRVFFMRFNIDDLLPLRLTTYTAIALSITCGLALFVYGR